MCSMPPGDLWTALPDFTAVGTTLRVAGTPVHLKGLSWFGAEGTGKVQDGLWANTLDFYLRFVAEHRFNAIRIPFALDTVLANPEPAHEMLTTAPELKGLKYLDVLERVVDTAASHGLLILLDLHRLKADRWPDDGLWYGPGVTLDTLKACWDLMQARFCKRWNVLGADILNEPHGAKWRDWAGAATQLGNFVLSKCARWVIFVEGVAHEGTKEKSEFFWGENLEDAAHRPVKLAVANKLVYSPHVRPPRLDPTARPVSNPRAQGLEFAVRRSMGLATAEMSTTCPTLMPRTSPAIWRRSGISTLASW